MVENRPILQAHKQTPWRLQIQRALPVLAALVILVIAISVYLNIMVQSATIGLDAKNYMAFNDRLESEIADLSTKLGSSTTQKAVEEKAKAAKFEPVSPKRVVYLKIPVYPGKQGPAVSSPPGETPRVYNPSPLKVAHTESLSDWIKKTLDEFWKNQELIP